MSDLETLIRDLTRTFGEDIAQEALVRVVKAGKLEEAKLRQYAFRTAANLSRNARRDRGVHQRLDGQYKHVYHVSTQQPEQLRRLVALEELAKVNGANHVDR